MKKINILLALTGVAFMLTSCDDYLDTLPDDRAEVDTQEDVSKLLVSAYSTNSAVLMMEMASDNVDDNGAQYSTYPGIDEMYRFKDVTSEFNDDPRSFWNGCYRSVATANEALASIREMGEPKELNPQKAEALLCRALGMFQLSNVFCMAYDPAKSNEYLGLPYPLEPEQKIGTEYERGTLEELYAHINADIEEALPLMDDGYMSTPKYHLNMKAAYAFAARFNLYYHKYDQVIKYATLALGSNPTAYLRNWAPYMELGSQDTYNRYIQSSENCNFLLLTAYSIAGRTLNAGAYLRYAHNDDILGYETFWARSPWAYSNSTSSNNLLYMAHTLYGNERITLLPKMFETFEYTDKVNGTGYAHIVDTYFTGDETLLCRAEAYALRNEGTDSLKALADINTWCSTNLEPSYDQMTRQDYTIDYLNRFMRSTIYSAVTPETAALRTIKKVLHPQGFSVEAGNQETLIQMILHMRRVTTMHQGLRFMDLKRYGIEYTHFVDKEEPIVFKAGDLRGAYQLPVDVRTAGLEANPR